MEEMIFLIQGRLLVMKRQTSIFAVSNSDSVTSSISNEDDDKPEYEVETGAWFGEACLFNDDCVHDMTVAAIMDSELAILPGIEYRRIAEKFPRLQQRHASIQRAFKNHQASISQLAY